MPSIWPFGRNKKKKSLITEEKLHENYDASAGTTRDKDHKTSKLTASQEIAPKLEKQEINVGQENGKNETNLAIRNPIQNTQSPRAITPLPSAHAREPLAEIENLASSRDKSVQQNELGSLTSLQYDTGCTRQPSYGVPTLKSKRNSATSELIRSKSGRSKASIKEREKEIRALASPIPVPKRPSSFSDGPLARDTKSFAGGLDRRLHRPVSEVSLPMAESLRTSFSGESGRPQNFKVTGMDALAPRPTIRYGEARAAASRKKSTKSLKKEKGAIIPEEPANEQTPPVPGDTRARVKDLADSLDSRALREVMERDQRRRDRKKLLQAEKLKRKLEREEERVRQAARTAAPMAPAELGADPIESEQPGLDETSPADRPPNVEIPSSRRDTETSVPWTVDTRDSEDMRDPFGDPRGSRPDFRLSSEQVSIRGDAVIESATAVRLSTISMSPPTSPVLARERTLSPSNLSYVASLGARDSPEPTSSIATSGYLHPEVRRDSETSAKQGSSWTSIFKRGGTKRKVSTDKEKEQSVASEFSNVSRESVLRKSPATNVPVVQRSFKRHDSAPHRKQSKFREDLPELPISPPRSRVQSPELDRPLSPYVDDSRKLEHFNNNEDVNTPIEDVHPALRDQLTPSRHQSFQGTASPDPIPLSQSLASIDSEGSWLSGRPPKRSSAPYDSVRASMTSLVQPVEEQEEPDFSRRDITSNTVRGPGGLSSQLSANQPGVAGPESVPRQGSPFPYDEAVKYDTVVGRRPNIVQRASVARSREGLLDEYIPNEEDSPISPLSPDADSPLRDSSIHRATSVTLGRQAGHARQLSAGSARLLDIPARSSSDAKRLSNISASTARSPLVSPRESVMTSPESPLDSNSKSLSSEPPT